MKMTRRLNEFVKEVAEIASDEIFTYKDCIKEYTDQILNDDFSCVVLYAASENITIPRVLKSALK